MTTTTVTRTLEAPPARVFSAVADTAGLTDVIPDVVRVEFLTEQRSGAGTRFQETVSCAGRKR